MTEESSLLDSNILVYVYDDTDKRKHEIAIEILVDCIGRGAPFVVSYQNLGEAVNIFSTKLKNKLSITNIKEIMNDFFASRQLRKVHYSKTALFKSLELIEKYGIHFWDALIVATMLENGIYTIYTENTKDFKKIPQITAINPFEKEVKKEK